MNGFEKTSRKLINWSQLFLEVMSESSQFNEEIQMKSRRNIPDEHPRRNIPVDMMSDISMSHVQIEI